MLDYIRRLEKRRAELESILCAGASSPDSDEYRAAAREMSEMRPAVELCRRLRSLESDLKSAEALAEEAAIDKDDKLSQLAAEECAGIKNEIARVRLELESALVPPDPLESKNVIVEIRAGTGGEEAAIFAGDLFRMYARFAASKNLETEVLDSSPTDLSGFKEIIFMVKGPAAGRYFRFESGVHRVQRVPATESSGRIHTSAVSVAVMPEALDVDIKIDEKDLRIDTYRSSGAGGQHVNKTDSAVRITHIPTGIVVTCQEDRSQIKNRARAMSILRARLLEAERLRSESARADLRKKQIGTGDRSEKIRTYNFPQNRLTDHRINFSAHNLPAVMEGDLAETVERLIKEDAVRRLAALTSENPSANPRRKAQK